MASANSLVLQLPPGEGVTIGNSDYGRVYFKNVYINDVYNESISHKVFYFKSGAQIPSGTSYLREISTINPSHNPKDVAAPSIELLATQVTWK